MPDDGRNSNAKNDVLFYSRLFGLRAGRHGLVLRRTCGRRTCGANTSSSNDTGAFQYRIKLVGCQAGESFRFTGWPEDFHMVDFVILMKRQPQRYTRLVTLFPYATLFRTW